MHIYIKTVIQSFTHLNIVKKTQYLLYLNKKIYKKFQLYPLKIIKK